MKTHEELEETLKKFNVYGCADGNCIVKRKRGQHTNGGCHCLDRLESEKRQEIKLYIKILRGELT